MALFDASSDAEIIALLRNGDEIAFAEIYKRYYALLQNHIYKRLGDLEETKDVLQELFAQIWYNREQLPDIKNFSGYLYVIARNKVFNSLAHQKIIAKYAGSLQEFIDGKNYSTDLAIREKEFKAMIEKEIDALPEKMRFAFRLSRESGFSHKEIAGQMGISESTVSNQITSALKILRVKLGAFFFMILL
jgi:RNA polymerase sigma-70 factor (ECF subfamily)